MGRFLAFSLATLVGPAIICCPHATAQPASALQESASSPRKENKSDFALEFGKAIERQIAGGETHTYTVTLVSGEFFHAVMEERGIDVSLVLLGPDGRKVVEGSEQPDPAGLWGSKSICVIAEFSGDYRVQLQAAGNKFQTGQYEFVADERSPATENERNRVAATRLLLEAQQDFWKAFQQQSNEEAQKKAAAKYESALTLFQAAGDSYGQAWTLDSLAQVNRRLGDKQKALDYANQALSIWRSLGDRRHQCYALLGIGGIYLNLTETEKAVDYYTEALTLARAISDRRLEGVILREMALGYQVPDDTQKFLNYMLQALAIQRELGLKFEEAEALNSVGWAYSKFDAQVGLDYFNQSLGIYRQLGDNYMQAFELANIGDDYRVLGDYRNAIDSFNQTLPLLHSAGPGPGAAIAEGKSLARIGEAYEALGETARAIDYYEKVLTLYKTRKISPRLAYGSSLIGLARLSLLNGEHEKVMNYLSEALAVAPSFQLVANRVELSVKVGLMFDRLGEHDEALNTFAKALEFSRSIKSRSLEAEALYRTARLERDIGRLAEARSHIEEVIEIIESIRSRIADPEISASYLSTVSQRYELLTDILMRLHQKEPNAGFAAAALQSSERGRARVLLDLLTEARADIRRGVDAQLLERETQLRRKLNARAEQQTSLLSSKAPPGQLAAIEQEIRQGDTEYEQVEAEIRMKSPRYAALTQPRPLSVKEIQEQVLDAETALVEYQLGDERSFVWVVTKNSLTSFELPKRAEIEEEVKRVYAFLTARNLRPKGEAEEQRQARVSQAESEYQPASAHLSQILLGPVAQSLGSKRLLVVPDGALNYLPFAALPAPRTNTSAAKDWQPLMIDHEIVSLPSATALAVLRRDLAGRKPAPKAVTVIADPVFDKEDARVGVRAGHPQMVGEPTNSRKGRANPESSIASVDRDVERSAGETGLVDNQAARIPRLPFSRREADAIISLVQNSNGMKAVDFKANRATATSSELTQYRIIHFATHGLLNSQHPELSGVILSLVDEHGAPQDGFLRLNEVYNLNLPAELVVLSACNTGLGKEVRGEGLVGLTRGFMYAGAARVAASMWRVDDAATAELMRLFYTGMLKDGRPPAAALRAAQVEMFRRKRWQSPYYWAAFVLQGEWK
jgi:CHAT domain-containing protein/tetratricopeptide (TPR) repeat protein